MEEHNLTGPPDSTVSMDGRSVTVRYRDVDIVRVGYLEVILDAGGSRSFIMQSRLNQSARLLNLNLHLHARRGEWTVETPSGSYEFRDGMKILRSRGGQHEYTQYPTETEPAP